MVRNKRKPDWFDRKTTKEEMKTLGATELSLLRSLVKDVLATCESDDTGITADLYDKALSSAEVLGIVHVSDSDPYTGEELEDDTPARKVRRRAGLDD